MEAWDVLVIGDGPAALRSASVSAKNGAKTLLISATALGNGDLSALDGLAAPIQEMNNRGHREDTIKSGYFLCDQDIVTAKTNMAIDEMNHQRVENMLAHGFYNRDMEWRYQWALEENREPVETLWTTQPPRWRPQRC